MNLCWIHFKKRRCTRSILFQNFLLHEILATIIMICHVAGRSLVSAFYFFFHTWYSRICSLYFEFAMNLLVLRKLVINQAEVRVNGFEDGAWMNHTCPHANVWIHLCTYPTCDGIDSRLLTFASSHVSHLSLSVFCARLFPLGVRLLVQACRNTLGIKDPFMYLGNLKASGACF